MEIHLDVETFSEADLTKVGAYEYFRNKTTKLLCANYQIGTNEGGQFKPSFIGSWVEGEPRPERLCQALASACVVWAHNAEFEREAVNNKTDWGHIAPEQLRCTLALAACQSLPLALDKLGNCLNIDRKKDAVGKRLMMKLCKPNSKGEITVPTKQQRKELSDYCARDVEAEIDIGNKLLPFTPIQLITYHNTVKINERGIPVNMALVHAALETKDKLKHDCDIELQELTGEGIDMVMSPIKLMNWLRSKGVEVSNTQKETIEKLLTETLNPTVLRVLQIRGDISNTSLKKYDTMLKAGASDGRIRGTIQFHGAFTGRWAGRLLQPQNFPRPTIKGELESKVMTGQKLDDPVGTLKSLIRHAIKAPEGKEFICADWANIEGRMLAYLAGEEWKLEAFRDYDSGAGHDLYKLAYAKSFGINPSDVTDDQRFIGKVQELALGYGGGAGAIAAFSGDTFTNDEREDMKRRYRDANRRIQDFWHDLNNSAIRVVGDSRSLPLQVGKISMKYSGGNLYIMLPSGRCIRYPNATIELSANPWGGESKKLNYMKYINGQWLKTQTFGGKLAENVTQAACACLMMDVFKRVPDIIMSVHDEIVCEVDEGSVKLKDFESEFSKTPDWCKGLPINSEGWIGKNYRK